MFRVVFSLFLVLFLSFFSESKRFMGPTDISNQTFAEVSVCGPCKLHQVKADKISVIGSLDFDQLEVRQEVSIIGPVSGMLGQAEAIDVTGPLNLRRFLCHNLNVTGPSQFNRVRVYCKSTLVGSVEAKSCKFEGLILNCDVCRFEDVETGDITFKRITGKDPVRLELVGRCVIRGKIHFENENGLIILHEEGSEIEGPIQGATLVRAYENSSREAGVKQEEERKDSSKPDSVESLNLPSFDDMTECESCS